MLKYYYIKNKESLNNTLKGNEMKIPDCDCFEHRHMVESHGALGNEEWFVWCHVKWDDYEEGYDNYGWWHDGEPSKLWKFCPYCGKPAKETDQ